MLTWVVSLAIAGGLVHFVSCQSTTILGDEREWNCSQDHRAHHSNSRMFLMSPNGFGAGAHVVEASCPTRFQEFSQENGVCRCLYNPELRALLQQPCQARLVPGNRPELYDTLVPSLDRETIEDLYVRQTCYALLPGNMVNYFVDQGVNPLLFNMRDCKCDWTPEAEAISGRPVGEGQLCEVLVDQNFTSRVVSYDEVGNTISVFPYEKQRNMTVVDGGSLFGEDMYAMVSWKLMGTDFEDLTLVSRFRPERGSTGNQRIYSNVCVDESGLGGFVDLSYNPVLQQYRLLFFHERPVICIPQNTLGSYVEQNVQVTYRRGSVSMKVNGFNCDVTSLNPIRYAPHRRIRFSTTCPFQLGGSIFNTPSDVLGGRSASTGNLRGIYKRFTVVRKCEMPPTSILDRIQGVV